MTGVEGHLGDVGGCGRPLNVRSESFGLMLSAYVIIKKPFTVESKEIEVCCGIPVSVILVSEVRALCLGLPSG